MREFRFAMCVGISFGLKWFWSTYTPRIEWDDCIVWVHEHAEVEMISGFSTKTGNKSIFFRWEIEFPSRNMMYCFVLLRKIEKFTQKLFTNFFCWGYNLLPWDRVLHWILEDVNWTKSTWNERTENGQWDDARPAFEGICLPICSYFHKHWQVSPTKPQPVQTLSIRRSMLKSNHLGGSRWLKKYLIK